MTITPDPILCSWKTHRDFCAHLPSLDDSLLATAIIVSNELCVPGERMNIGEVHQTLNSYAETVSSRARGCQVQAKLAHLHDLMFDEMKFRGTTKQTPEENLLACAMRSRAGSQSVMSLIYVETARRCGLSVHGVGLPGHFIVGVDVGEERPMYVDPSTGGRVLTV